MAFLDEQSRAVLFEPPEAYEDAQARYALTSEDIVFVKEHRRSHNRIIGLALRSNSHWCVIWAVCCE